MDRAPTIFLVLAIAGAIVVILTRDVHALRVPGRPAVADNEDMLNAGDNSIVGMSNTIGTDPVGRIALAANRWPGVLPGLPAPLRQVTVGTSPGAHINRGECR